MKLRWYQERAVERTFQYFEKQGGNPLIVLPTGTGKSLVIAEICRRVDEMDKKARVIIATHVSELVAQNYAEFVSYYPDADAGIYSAGLNRRQSGRRFTFGGIQSCYRNVEDFPAIDILIVDEAHTIPHSSEGMWRSFIADLRLMNPYLKVIGLTATPYRMKSGMLHKGKDALFDEIVFEYNVGDAVKEGYLSEISNTSDESGEEIKLDTYLDVSKVGVRGGEYIEKELQAAVDIDRLTQACVKEIMKHGKNRGSWLIFCSGVAHAEHVRDALMTYGVTCESVSTNTSKGERSRILSSFKSGEIKSVTNNNVLTTGFNAPGVDMIAFLRPTKSPGLWVQMLGRGMRLAPGKENCMILDFTNNTAQFGVIDKIVVDTKKKETKGDAPVKVCPECFATCFAGCRTCPDCNYEFPPNEAEISARVSKDALLSHQLTTQTASVIEVKYYRHHKENKPDSMRVDYVCGLNIHSEYVCLGHSGFPREEACQWWNRHSAMSDKTPPRNTDEALDRIGELKLPKKIYFRKQGKYSQILDFEA